MNNSGTIVLKINIQGNENIGVRIKGTDNINDIESKVLYLNSENCFVVKQQYDYDYNISKYEDIDKYFIV